MPVMAGAAFPEPLHARDREAQAGEDHRWTSNPGRDTSVASKNCLLIVKPARVSLTAADGGRSLPVSAMTYSPTRIRTAGRNAAQRGGNRRMTGDLTSQR
jgi:hypothetical protein